MCDHSNELSQLSRNGTFLGVVMVTMLYKVVLPFEPVDDFLKRDHSNESYYAVPSRGLFIMLYKVALTFESVDEILKCDHSNERY